MQPSIANARLLADLCRTAVGAAVQVVGDDGSLVYSCGAAADDAVAQAVCSLPPGGRLQALLPQGCSAEVVDLFDAALRAVARCEGLEQDMHSMNQGLAQLMEQAHELGATVPRLSGKETVTELANEVLEAILRGAGARRAVFLLREPRSDVAEALGYVEATPDGAMRALPYPGDLRVPADEGLLAAALAGGGRAIWHRIGDGERPAPGSPESFAAAEVLVVPVACDDGEQRQALGAVFVCDAVGSTEDGGERSFGSQECQFAETFASMLGLILGVRQAAEYGKEMSMAQAIQAQILPSRKAAAPGFDIAGDSRTCGNVGGDYFDFVPFGAGRTLAVVADVSGHNLASGMMMVSARATLRALALRTSDAADLFTELASSMFVDLSRTERFLTAAGVCLDAADGSVEIVNAGHNPPLLWRRGQKSVQRIESDSTVLGFLPEVRYDKVRLTLEEGDSLLLYTDGVTEAVSQDDEMFGDDRLEAVFVQAARHGAEAVVGAVLSAVQAFRRPGEPGDDVTVVAITRAAAQPQGGRP